DREQSMYVVTMRAATRFFETYGVSAQIGRTFSQEDYEPSAPKTIVISADLWELQYGADAQVIGRQISLDGEPRTVIGVMPPNFWPNGSGVPRVWTPYVFNAEERTDRQGGQWQVIARLRRGVDFNQAQVEMDSLSQQLTADYPDSYKN